MAYSKVTGPKSRPRHANPRHPMNREQTAMPRRSKDVNSVTRPGERGFRDPYSVVRPGETAYRGMSGKFSSD